MPRSPKECPRLVRLSNLRQGYEALILLPQPHEDAPGHLLTIPSTNALGAIVEALDRFPDLVGVGHFTENKQP